MQGDPKEVRIVIADPQISKVQQVQQKSGEAL